VFTNFYSPKQDIRRHMRQIPNGFSGRTIDTKYITPTLSELGYLFNDGESGWLTRSIRTTPPF
jgi:DNA (cytosine-5)-methyltransferase 1